MSLEATSTALEDRGATVPLPLSVGDYFHDPDKFISLPSIAECDVVKVLSIICPQGGELFRDRTNEHSIQLGYKSGIVRTHYAAHESIMSAERITLERVKELFREKNAAAVGELSDYADILRRVFPRKAVTQLSSDGNVYSYIHIDQETVTNNSGLSTVIRDFVFRIKYTRLGDGFVLSSIRAQVFKATKKQIRASYAFSHIQRAGIYDWSSCCMGGTELSSTFVKLKMGMTKVNFEMFLYQLKDYIKHESLQGGPYVRISSIHSSSNAQRIDNSHLNYCFDHIVREKSDIKINVSSTGGTIGCTFDRNSLSESLLATHSVPDIYIGRISDGVFMSENTDQNNPNLSLFMGSSGLCVNDDYCSIDLAKSVHEEERSTDIVSNTEECVSPEFMDAFEKKYKNQFEGFIINKILNKNEKKERRETTSTEEHQADNQQGTFSYGELPA